MSYMSLDQVHRDWTAIKDELNIDSSDECALSESWNNYTDSEFRDGNISDLQYHYCPAHDEAMPPDDEELDWLLEQMDVDLSYVAGPVRSGWPDGSAHFTVTLKRGDEEFVTPYSMGPRTSQIPELADVMYSLLMDTAGDPRELSPNEWADELGIDHDLNALRQHYGCCREAEALDRLFDSDELEDLRGHFEDY